VSAPQPRYWLRRTIALAVIFVGTFGLLDGAWRALCPGLDAELAPLLAWRPAQDIVLLDRHGVVFDRMSDERRSWAPLSELPPVLIEAVLAAEDRRYYQHRGVDLRAITRALHANLSAGGVVQGGSTLSQQLVKNLVVGGERSLHRKINEALLARRLDERLSKDEQLERYLNLVYLGGGNHGVEAAAQDYFGRPAKALGAGQAALLAGLIRAPSRDDPRAAPERGRAARDRVLRAMIDEGTLSAAEGEALMAAPLDLAPAHASAAGAPVAYQTAARTAALALYGGAPPWSEALVLRTALDPALQAAAEAAVEAAARAVEDRNGVAGAILGLSAEELRARSDRGGAPVRAGACFEARVEGRGGRLVAGDWSGALHPEDGRLRARPQPGRAPGRVRDGLENGALLPICLDKALRARLDRRPWVEGAAVVIEVETGAVRAATAGRRPTLMGFHRGTQAQRQPGSAFKPFVYAAALEAGMDQLDTVLDAPIRVPGSPGRPDWQPRNFSPGFAGPLPMRAALARSLNTPAVRIAQKVGPQAVIDVATKLGVHGPLRADLALSLGASEVTVLDMAVAGANLARMGWVREPVWIEGVEARGRCCARPGDPLPGGPLGATLPGALGPRAVRGSTARQLIEMMQGAVSHGTARDAARPGEPLAAKTGTTTDALDAWFVAIRPDHVVVVWLGADDHAPLGPEETGGRAALPAARAILDALPPPQAGFAVPDDVLVLPSGTATLSLPRDRPAALNRIRRAPPMRLPEAPVETTDLEGAEGENSPAEATPVEAAAEAPPAEPPAPPAAAPAEGSVAP
jgi:penicillin-binding protein 1A